MSRASTPSYQIGLTASARDLEQIIDLLRANHADAVAASDRDSQGFVTMNYTVDELTRMKGPYQHVVARADGKVVGYALVLLREHGDAFALLDEMFREIDRALAGRRYFVMGQVCVAREFRGSGMFRALYEKLREQMSADFELVATEVSKRNARSSLAHQSVGFRQIGPENPAWEVIAWDWR